MTAILRNGTDVFAWYRLAPQRWSFRSDSQRQDLIAAIAGQYAELAGRWLHLRVTTRPYPIRMWAEAHVHNAVNRLPDTQGALSFDDYLIGEQQQFSAGRWPRRRSTSAFRSRPATWSTGPSSAPRRCCAGSSRLPSQA